MKPKTRAAPSAKAKALQWLSQREHSRVELRAKLLRWLQRQAAAAEAAHTAASAAEPVHSATQAAEPVYTAAPAAKAPPAWDSDLSGVGGSEGPTLCGDAPGPDDSPHGFAANTARDAREAAAAWREQTEARVDALLDELDAARYLSETRFIESRIHARQARFGNRRIQQELREHGLKPAAQDLAALRESEGARARQVLQQRFADPQPDSLSPADRQRRARFLAARGFTFDAIQAALRLPED